MRVEKNLEVGYPTLTNGLSSISPLPEAIWEVCPSISETPDDQVLGKILGGAMVTLHGNCGIVALSSLGILSDCTTVPY